VAQAVTDEQHIGGTAIRLVQRNPINAGIGLAGAGLVRTGDRVDDVVQAEPVDQRVDLIIVDVRDDLHVDGRLTKSTKRVASVGPQRRVLERRSVLAVDRLLCG
jgi:hypothetical protein